MTHYSARDRSKPTLGGVENQAWTAMPIDGAARESVSTFGCFSVAAIGKHDVDSMSPGIAWLNSGAGGSNAQGQLPHGRSLPLRLSSRMLASGGKSSRWLQKDLYGCENRIQEGFSGRSNDLKCCKFWSGREDLNLRPPGPEPGALPG
jgi:hypothetical protein